jgi:hypothetical protein
MVETATSDIKKQLADDIGRAIEKQPCPAFLTEGNLETAGIQSISKSQHYRAVGGGLPFVKHAHRILYPTAKVVDYLASRMCTHSGAYTDTPRRLEAIRKNLSAAHQKRQSPPDIEKPPEPAK